MDDASSAQIADAYRGRMPDVIRGQEADAEAGSEYNFANCSRRFTKPQEDWPNT